MPSIVPPQGDDDLYFVLCDYGQIGLAYAETDPADADREAVIRRLAQGQYSSPQQILCVNASRGVVSDVTDEILDEAAAQAINEP